MEGSQSRSPLPEELVERILAMVPFPQIFKARTLSKSWHTRCSSISSQFDEEKKLLALSFQKRVCEWSDKWKPRSPVFLFDDFLIAYNSAAQHWRKIPTLSALPATEAMELKVQIRNNYRADRLLPSSVLVGALLFITTDSGDLAFVVNIFTGSWKVLPALPARPPMPGRWPGSRKRLVSGGKDMYKVIMFYPDAGCACAWIYASNLGAWRSKRVEVLDVLEDFELGWKDVYLNGVLYVLVRVQRIVWGFLAFDVKDETFSLFQMPPTDILSWGYVRGQQLVACNGTVYVPALNMLNSVMVLEVDLVSRRWSKVIRGPPPALKCISIDSKASGDGECLFFEGVREAEATREWVTIGYNVRKDEWSCVGKISRMIKQSSGLPRYVNANISLEPGMNPFVEA